MVNLLFPIIFLTICFGFPLLLYVILKKTFPSIPKYVLYILLTLPVLLFTSFWFEHVSWITEYTLYMVNWISGFAYGFLIVILIPTTPLFILSLVWKTYEKELRYIGIILSIIAVSIAIVQTATIKTVTYELPFPIDEEIVIAQVSDLHLGPIYGSRHLSRFVTRINNLHPDFVVITGDIFDGSKPINEKTVAPLNNVTVPMYFVFGNHEYYFGVENSLALLATTPVIVLQNELIQTNGIQLIGIDADTSMFTTENEALKNIAIDSTIPSILLYHYPSGLKDAHNAGIQLQLSGHTHRGQIFPLNIILRFFNEYTVYGKYTYKNTNLIVSSGGGANRIPVRFLTRNELVIIRLIPEK